MHFNCAYLLQLQGRVSDYIIIDDQHILILMDINISLPLKSLHQLITHWGGSHIYSLLLSLLLLLLLLLLIKPYLLLLFLILLLIIILIIIIYITFLFLFSASFLCLSVAQQCCKGTSYGISLPLPLQHIVYTVESEMVI